MDTQMATTGHTQDHPSGGVAAVLLAAGRGARMGGDRPKAYLLLDDVPYVRNVLAGASFARQSADRNEASFYAGANLWRFTYLGEVDLITDNTPEVSPKDQLAAYAEVNLLLFDWLKRFESIQGHLYAIGLGRIGVLNHAEVGLRQANSVDDRGGDRFILE